MKLAYLVIGALLLAAAAAAETNIEIVFDSSSSMSQEVEGQKKIDIAKSVVSDYLSSVTEANVALRLYGHRSSECTDTELVLPLGSDKAKISAAVQKMKPTGFTPIEYSLRKAAQDLPEGEENFIILVSDGEETCGGDPCKAVKEIRAAGNNFVLYAIGFGINSIGKEQLECMADKYYDANNADELKAAFQKIEKKRATRLTVASRDPQKGTPGEKEKPQLNLFYAPNVKVFDSARTREFNVTSTIYNPEGIGLLDLAATHFYLDPGTYDLQIRYSEFYGWLTNIKPFWMDDVVVTEGETTTVYAEVNTGKLTVNLYTNKAKAEGVLSPNVYDCGGRSDEDCISYDSDYVLYHDSPGILSSFPRFDLEPGVYNIYASGSGCIMCDGADVLFKGVEVKVGEETVLNMCAVESGTDECPGETGTVRLTKLDDKDITVIDYGKAPTGGAITQPPAPPSAAMEEYCAPDNSFCFSIPTNWGISTTRQGILVYFISPDLKANANVAIDKSQDYTGKSIHDMPQEAATGTLSQAFPSFSLDSYRNRTVGGKPIVEADYTITMNGTEFKQKQVYFISGSVLYVITFSAKESDFSSFEGVFDSSVNSLRFPGGGTPPVAPPAAQPQQSDDSLLMWVTIAVAIVVAVIVIVVLVISRSQKGGKTAPVPTPIQPQTPQQP